MRPDGRILPAAEQLGKRAAPASSLRSLAKTLVGENTNKNLYEEKNSIFVHLN